MKQKDAAPDVEGVMAVVRQQERVLNPDAVTSVVVIG